MEDLECLECNEELLPKEAKRRNDLRGGGSIDWCRERGRLWSCPGFMVCLVGWFFREACWNRIGWIFQLRYEWLMICMTLNADIGQYLGLFGWLVGWLVGLMEEDLWNSPEVGFSWSGQVGVSVNSQGEGLLWDMFTKRVPAGKSWKIMDSSWCRLVGDMWSFPGTQQLRLDLIKQKNHQHLAYVFIGKVVGWQFCSMSLHHFSQLHELPPYLVYSFKIVDIVAVSVCRVLRWNVVFCFVSCVLLHKTSAAKWIPPKWPGWQKHTFSLWFVKGYVSPQARQAGYHCKDCWWHGKRSSRCESCGSLQQLMLGDLWLLRILYG